MYLESQMTNIEWTIENEIQLLFAMINHKPIGINKHFQMMAIHDKFTSSLNCELSAKEIWKKLETYYDLQALDESDKLPFPNNQEDFTLPQDTFASLLEDRLHTADVEDEEPVKGRVKTASISKKEEKEDGTLTPVLKREKQQKDTIDDDEDEKDTPRRMMKRARDTIAKKSSPSPATTKRRR
ncbi:MRG/MORF4L-binding protein [Armadillidium nasatum]|uniref:MRG/MORF4L-binding protein n=1 Tax=Armadillidium nasatum TaxID=96803 RepID=A0A5N5SU28_9CRUS|nr:MRG/MORF4L-binding protein [Armadillidium nasatum]